MKHSVEEFGFENGLRGVVVDVPGANVINLEIHFNSGFQFAHRRIYELPHVLEHLIGCGSKRYPQPNQFKAQVQKNGAFRNAYTSIETNGYVLEFAAFELERMLDLVEEWLVHPLLPEEACATEISNIREELNRLEADHDSACAYNLMARTFPHKSLNLAMHIKQLSDITLEDVRTYYERTHTSANARFYIAGDIGAASSDVPSRLEAILGKLPRGSRAILDDTRGLGLATPVLERRDVKTIHYRFASFAGQLSRRERNALLLVRMILFNGFTSRIYGEARRRGLAYHISGASSVMARTSQLGINGFVTAENITPLFELIASEYRRLREGALGKPELSAAKDRLIGSTLRSYQTPADILSWYVGRYDAEEEIYPFDEQLRDLQTITTGEVVEVAGRMVADEAQAISFVGDVGASQAEGYYQSLRPLWHSGR